MRRWRFTEQVPPAGRLSQGGLVWLLAMLALWGCKRQEQLEVVGRRSVPAPAPGRRASAAPGPQTPRSVAPGPPRGQWPSLPATAGQAQDLWHKLARRSAAQGALPDAQRIVAAALRADLPLVVGHGGVQRWLSARVVVARQQQRDAFVLWGTYHDAGGQLEAFGRLFGPGGLPGWTHVVVEQLDAAGRWPGVPAGEQRGDDAALGAYLARGDRAAYALLRRRQLRDD